MRYSCFLFLVLVACGDGGGGVGTLPDAPRAPDAGIDAPGVQPVTLTITSNAAPVAGIHTYFLNADSTVVKTVDTDATGAASATMVAGGSVTVINPFVVALGGIRFDDLRTFMGVKPGDHLVLAQTDSPPSITVPLTVPVVAQADTYEIRTTCGSGSILINNQNQLIANPTGDISLAGCNGMADILVLASGPVVEQPRFTVALYRANVAVADNVAVDLTTDVYHNLADVTFDYTNVASSTTSIFVSHRLATPRGAIFDTSNSTAITGTTASITLSEPTIEGAVGTIVSSVLQSGSHQIFQRRAVTATNTFDLAGLLPNFLGGDFYNAATKRLSWQEATVGVRPDLTLAEITVVQTQTTTRGWKWRVASPYVSGGELTFPTLPIDVANWAPNPDDQVDVTMLTHAKVPGGYDAIRAHIHDDTADPSSVIGAPTDTLLLVSIQNN